MSGRARSQFTYAILRVVPRIERGECMNAGVVLYCGERDFLAARAALDERRLAALAPDVAPVAELPPAKRFGWLVSPSSTIVQPSEVHSGLCEEPSETLAELFADLVE
jgi:hypothetical protein